MKQKEKITKWSEGSAYNALQDIAVGFQKSQILFTAVKYDIFTQINEGKNTAALIAENSNLNQKALEKLLNALVSIKLLNKHTIYYENSELSEKHLVKTSEDYYGFVLHNADLWNSWGTLPEVIKTGKNVANTPIFEKDSVFIEDFLLSWDWQIKLELDIVMQEISLKGVKRFLKIGAYSYRHAIETAKSHPEIEITVIDFPNIITVAEKIAKNEYDCHNIKFVPFDILNDDFEQGFDLVFVDSIIDEYSIFENISLMKKVYESINKGGKLIVYRLLINDSRTEPLAAAFASINLLLNTPAGDSYTYSDVWVVLKEAGFKDIDFFRTDAKTHIITASKSLLG